MIDDKYVDSDYGIMNKVLAFILIAIQLSCESQPSLNNLRNDDPYKKSFEGKGIDFVVIEDYGSVDIRDTLFFSSEGLLIKKSNHWSIKRYEYDTLGLLSRYYTNSDVTYNYEIQSTLKGLVVDQVWREVLSNKFKPSQPNYGESYRVKLIYNEKGLLIEKIDSLLYQRTKYFYKGDNLIQKTIYDLQADTSIKQFDYQYRNGQIEKINELRNGNLYIQTLFDFDNALPYERLLLEYEEPIKRTFEYHYYN